MNGSKYVRLVPASQRNEHLQLSLIVLFVCSLEEKTLSHHVYKKAQVFANTLLDTRSAKCVNRGLFSEAD